MDKKELNKLLGIKKKPSLFKRMLTKLFLCIIFFMSIAILCKTSSKVNNFVEKNILNNNFSFTKIKSIYNKYLGGVLPLEINTNNTKEVFNEKIKYSNISKYQDGAILTVDNNYLIPALEEGLVVFIGKKDGYGNTIIIENEEGINIWYGNINKAAVKLYDYVSKGNYIGDTTDDKLYLVYMKDGNVLDYEKYFN